MKFVRYQREKGGTKSILQIAAIDVIEKKTKKKHLLKWCIIGKQATQIKKPKTDKEIINQEKDSMLSDSNEVSEDFNYEREININETTKGVKENIGLYNTMNTKNVALASLRHHTGLRGTVEIATAALIDAKVITERDTSFIIDHNKVKRAQENIGKELTSKHENELINNGLSCILFDSRKGETKVFIDVEGRKFPGLVKEEHYTVCSKPGGNYLFHFVPEESD